MTKATGMGPLPRFLEERAGWRSLQSVFATEGVPLDIMNQRETRMPLASMTAIFEGAARAAGDRTFGFTVGAEMSHEHFGLWAVYCASANTLGNALRRTVRSGHFQQTGGGLTLETEGSFAIWRYYRPVISERHIQHSDHLIGPMRRLIRSFLGPNWNPAWIELDYPGDSLARLLEAQLECPLRFSSPCVGIGLEASHLRTANHAVATRQSARQVTLLDVEASETAYSYDNFFQSVFWIVILRLIDGSSDIEGAAQMTGLGVQAFQRLLRQEGLTYRKLLDHARLSRARALLCETGQTVTEIAFALGYTDHANFTRAFNRWKGCSPSVYRINAAAERAASSANAPRET